MASCNFTEENIWKSIMNDNYKEDDIRKASDMLLRALWKEHPRRMRELWMHGRAVVPSDLDRVDALTQPSIVKIPDVGNRIAFAVATDLNMSVDDMRSMSQERRYVTARAIVAKILSLRGWSSGQIACAIGRSHHSTVLNVLEKFEYLIRINEVAKACWDKNRLIYCPSETKNG